MRPSRLLAMSGAISLLMAGSTSVAFTAVAQAATASPCGIGATAGISSCVYASAGPATFTVPPGVYNAYFTVDGAGNQAAGPGSQVSAVVNVQPGQTYQVNVGGADVAAGSSDVSVDSSGGETEVLVATGGGAQSGSDYITAAAKSSQTVADARTGNGEVTVSWPRSAAPTTLTATPAVVGLSGLSLYLFNLSATLSDASGPVAGQQITFMSGATELCTATTNADGTASCDATASLLSIVLSLGYTASYAGSADYQSASASAGLIG
jgi:hypothetical protein